MEKKLNRRAFIRDSLALTGALVVAAPLAGCISNTKTSREPSGERRGFHQHGYYAYACAYSSAYYYNPGYYGYGYFGNSYIYGYYDPFYAGCDSGYHSSAY